MNKCKSCGFDIDIEGKTLCFYCHYRGHIGTMKMIILSIIKNSEERLTLEEIMDALNDFDYIGRPVSKATLKKLLTKYTNELKILTARKRRRQTGGRFQLERKLTVRGEKRLELYLKRWRMGLPVILKTGKKSKIKMISEYRRKARVIREKIIKNEYPLYSFIFTNRRNLGNKNE